MAEQAARGKRDAPPIASNTTSKRMGGRMTHDLGNGEPDRRLPRLRRRPHRAETPAERLMTGDPLRLRLTEARDRTRANLGPGWRPPAPPTATRIPALKSKGSMRVLMASMDDVLTPCESGGEFNDVRVSRARADVVAVHVQTEPVAYVDEDGVERRHTPDVVLTLSDGSREAHVVKPDARAEAARRLARTFDRRRVGGIGRWRHVGDAALPRSVVRRADQIAWVRRDGPFPGDPVLERVRAFVDRPMTVAEAVAGSGAEGWGYRAVVRLIADRVLRMRNGWTIAYERTVEPVAATNVNNDQE